MVTILCVIAALLILLLLCMRGNSAARAKRLHGFCYAHRGLHGGGIPENYMAAFSAAKEKGYGIELDVHLMRDGALAVLHDAALERTTGEKGVIEDMTVSEIEAFRLEGTEEKIPLFERVLSLYDGAAPIIVELKPHRGNHAALCAAVCRALDTYTGEYAIESFDPRCILWLRKNRPDIIRGQLSQNFFKTDDKLFVVIKFLLTHNLLNFLTAPDFIAYRFSHRHSTPSIAICKKLWRMQCVGWTLVEETDRKAAEREGWLSIFEEKK